MNKITPRTPEFLVRTPPMLSCIVRRGHGHAYSSGGVLLYGPRNAYTCFTLVLVRYHVLFDTDRYLNFVRYSILML